MFCPHCLEPLRETWPLGAGFAMLGMFHAVLEDNRCLVATGGDLENVPKFMERVKPVCEWIGREITEKVIQSALDGKCYGQEGKNT